MTTPVINTPYGVICDAYQDAGLVEDEGEPSPAQLAKGMRRLRDLINFWQTKGLKLWVNEDVTVPLTDGVATYTFSPTGSVVMTKPLRVLEAYYLVTASQVQRPLTPMAWRDFLTSGTSGTLIGNRSAVNQYFVDKQATRLVVTFWPCPDANEAANGVVHLLMQTQITNPASLTETMQFPEEWRMALRWGLADDLATGQPQAIMDRCQAKAEIFRTALEDWDVEDAPVTFAPDSRGQGDGGSFV